MKNKLFKTLLTVAVFAISVISFSCIAHAADVEIIPSEDGNMLKIYTENAGELSDVYKDKVNYKYRYKHIKVSGKMNDEDFIDLSSMSLHCKSIDLRNVETTSNIACEFCGRYDLEKFIFPSSLKVIGRKNFIECYNLKEVVLPENLESIEHDSFVYCPNLELDVPKNVKIGKDVFAGSPKVSFFRADPASVPEVQNDELVQKENAGNKTLFSCFKSCFK